MSNSDDVDTHAAGAQKTEKRASKKAKKEAVAPQAEEASDNDSIVSSGAEDEVGEFSMKDFDFGSDDEP